MTVRYNPVLGWIFLVLGLVNVFLGGWLLLLGNFQLFGLVGVLVTVIGVLYLTRPYFTVTQYAVTVRPLIGSGGREFPLRSPQDLRVDGGRLVVNQADGQPKKLPVARWSAHSGDWAAAFAPLTGS